MKRWVYAYRAVAGPPERLASALRSGVAELLKAAAVPVEGSEAVDGSFGMRLGAPIKGVPAKSVRVTAGVAAHPDNRLRIPVMWHAEPARTAFPEFEGALELEPMSEALSQLSMVGTYTLPLGAIGAAVDSTLLAGAAQRTAERLVGHVAAALEDVVRTPGKQPRAAIRSRTLRVADVMTSEPVVLDPSLPLRAAAMLLFHRRIRGAPVVTAAGELEGVLTETDLLDQEAQLASDGVATPRRRARRQGAPKRAKTVGEACTKPARVTVSDASLRAAARELLDRDVGRLVVVDAGRIVGIVTRHDVLTGLIRSDVEIQAAVEEVLDTLAEPELHAMVRWGDVTLSGAVSHPDGLSRVTHALESVDGVAGVIIDPDRMGRSGAAADDERPAVSARSEKP
ncbi:MAG TPA: CBS domain-containing protein [Egibacteraceae bacterium]|nr:CBS domain-containing protein [Egibacteraceae bacterium]